MQRRSLVFVISDFISTPGWAEPLAHLAQRHEIVAVRLYDPLEMELPDLGLLVMRDAETGEQLFVDTHDRAFRKRFAAVAERREKELRSASPPGRRGRAGVVHQRRSYRCYSAVRRPAQAAQPVGGGRKPAAAPERNVMTFLWPEMLWLLLIVPALVAGYFFLLRRKKEAALRYASLSMVKEAMGAGQKFRRHIPPLLFLVALIAMIVAIARPAAVVTLPSQHQTIILAMDVSGSMRATDVQPNRISAAQAAAKAFVAEQPSNVRIGVVSFAGTAAVVQTPTKIARTSLPPSIDSSCNAPPLLAAASSSPWRRSSRCRHRCELVDLRS